MFEKILPFRLDETGDSRLDRLVRELKRALHAGRYEQGKQGLVHVPRMRLDVGGVYDVKIRRHKGVIEALASGDADLVAHARRWVKRHRAYLPAGEFETIDACLEPNLIPTAGLTHLLGVNWGALAKISTWYIAPFSSDSTPLAGWESNWAGVTSGPVATEFTAYDEVNRQAATFAAAASASIATPTATLFTISTGQSGVTIYGATLNSIQTQSYDSTDQVLASAFRFASPKSGLGAADEIEIKYTVTATSS